MGDYSCTLLLYFAAVPPCAGTGPVLRPERASDLVGVTGFELRPSFVPKPSSKVIVAGKAAADLLTLSE